MQHIWTYMYRLQSIPWLLFFFYKHFIYTARNSDFWKNNALYFKCNMVEKVFAFTMNKNVCSDSVDHWDYSERSSQLFIFQFWNAYARQVALKRWRARIPKIKEAYYEAFSSVSVSTEHIHSPLSSKNLFDISIMRLIAKYALKRITRVAGKRQILNICLIVK